MKNGVHNQIKDEDIIKKKQMGAISEAKGS